MWKWEFVRSWKVARGRAQAGNLPRLSAATGKDGTFCYSRGIFEYEKAGSQGADDLSVKLTAVPGKRAEPNKMLGCLSYVVHKDSAEENTLWVTEVWDSEASHDASLLLPAVKNAVPQAKAIVASFEKVAVTSPVWGTGLKPAQVR